MPDEDGEASGGSVINEAAPEEPEEFDPDSLGPDVPTPPSTDVPTAPEPGGDADSEVVGLFWLLVLVFNVAVIALALGPMIGFFMGNWDLGLQIFLVGVLVFAYGAFRYYQFRETRIESGEQTDAPESDDRGDGAAGERNG